MILHENVNNPSKFRSDNSRKRKDMKSHYFRPLLFAARNKNSHKSTFTKAQLSDVNFKKRQKALMFEIVFLIF